MEVDAKVVRQGANAILVFVFNHYDFPDQQLYAANWYIHVTEDGEEDSLSFLAESVVTADSAWDEFHTKTGCLLSFSGM